WYSRTSWRPTPHARPSTHRWQPCSVRSEHIDPAPGARRARREARRAAVLALVCSRYRLERVTRSGPDVFLGDRAIAPLGHGHHPASAFELADDTRPIAGAERDRVGRDLRRGPSR